ncbi:MAG: TolC family protein [Spirochaetota bacterium]
MKSSSWQHVTGIFMVCMVICVAPCKIYAAEKLPLDEAIGLSLENNTAYRISFEKVKENRMKVRETWGMLWPQLSSDASYTRQWAEAGFNSQIEGQYDIKFINGQLTVNPGTFYHSLQASYTGRVAAENEVRTVKADTIITTIQLYYQMLLAGEMINLRKESIKALEENLRVVTVGYRKGTFSRLEFLRAKVSLSNEKTKLINAENDYQSARAALNVHLGREIGDPLQPDTAALDVDVDSLKYREINPEREYNLINGMIAEALKSRPELLQIKLAKDGAEHSAKAAQSVYMWPSFFVTGSYGTSKAISKERDSSANVNPTYAPIVEALNESMSESFAPSGWNDSWSVTFGATYRWGSLVPFDSSHAKASQLNSQARQAELQLEEFVKQVKVDVQQKFLKLKSASNSIYSQQGNVETAEESLRVSILQFRNGIIDNSKMLEANVELTTAKTLFIEALHNYQVAKAELNKAIGRDVFDIK